MKRVCVFSGSSPGARPEYRAAAVALGREIARRGGSLVYGGAHVGLMGAVADAALAEGGRVIGVIPEGLVDWEVAHTGLTELHVVGSMHERKALMAEQADGFMALPGGLGTLEELFEVLTWSQLGIHAKPCGLLDTDSDTGGYFRSLLEFLDHSVRERFVSAQHRAALLTDTHPAALLDRMAAWRPVDAEKWLDRQLEP